MNMKLPNQGLSSREEFIKYIVSIGFKSADRFYNEYIYKEFKIHLWKVNYDFYNGLESITYIPYTDLTPIKEHFKKELRAIKLKELLK